MHYRPASLHFRPLGQESSQRPLLKHHPFFPQNEKTINMVPKPTNAHKGIKIIKNEKPRFPTAQNKKEAKSHFLLIL